MKNLKKEFLELLDKDLEFRYAIAGYLGLSEILKRLDSIAGEQTKIWMEISKVWEEIKTLREGQNRLWEEVKDLREGQNRLWEELTKLREDMIEGFNLLKRHIDALGARWGIMAEEAFREGLRGLIERELGFRIERWVSYDDEGMVFGYPSRVEVDIAVKDERLVLVEVSSHIRASDVHEFKRKAELYERKTGRKPDRLIIITPYADEKALEMARKFDIEVYTKV